MVGEDIQKAARALSKKGSSKGGHARARSMTQEQRSESARIAAVARWNTDQAEASDVPWAVAEGKLTFQDRVIPCAVLDNEMRVLTQQGVLIAIGRARTAKGGEGASKDGTPAFLKARNLAPFITNSVREATKPIIFKPQYGGYSTAQGYRGIAYGCNASALPMICQAYIDAENAGVLLASQRHIAETARRLLEGLEHVAMVALVDEATGYQAVRTHNELQRILEAYVLPEHRPWVKAVPIEFTREIYRVWGWEIKTNSTQGPRFPAKLIRKYIYEQLPQPVLPGLDQQNPTNKKSQRRYRHHQFLTEEMGLEHFKTQLAGVTALLRASRDKYEFERLFRRAYSKNIQGEFDLMLEEATS